MDIHNASRRPLESKPATVERAPGQHGEAHAPAAVSGQQLATPATTQHLTTSSLLLDFLHLLESKLPVEAKALLNRVASQLRTDAAAGGAHAASSSAWAERLQHAADSGELTSWIPSAREPAHFGVRAYQAAAPVELDLAGLDAALSHTLASAEAVAAGSGKLTAEADSGGRPLPDESARQALLARRPDLLCAYEPRVRRRIRRRRAQRKQRRWRRG
jgi:hypothetical protein